MIAIDKIAEFNKHHCSEALKLFLDVDGALRGGSEKMAGDEAEAELKGTDSADTDPEASSEGASKRAGATNSRRLSSRASRWIINIVFAECIFVLNFNNHSSRKIGGTRRGSSTSNIGTSAPSDTTDTSPSSAAVAAPPAAETPPPRAAAAAAAPPPPPPRTPPSAPTAAPSGGGNLPPKPTGARMNLLGDINKLRKE